MSTSICWCYRMLDICKVLYKARHSFFVGQLSRYTSNPSHMYWHVVRRVLKYLKSFIDYGLHYCGYPSILEGFLDASWITNREDHSSTSGQIFTLVRAAISLGSTKQTCIADLTMVAEFLVLVLACKEAEWLRNLLYEIPLWPKPMSPLSLLVTMLLFWQDHTIMYIMVNQGILVYVTVM